MSADPGDIVRSYWDRVWIERDIDAVDDLMTDPSIRHTADGTRQLSVEQLKAHLRDVLCALRTEDVTFEAMAVDGNDVWVRATVHAVSLATMAPHNLAWLAQYRVEGDRISEVWALHQSGMDWSL